MVILSTISTIANEGKNYMKIQNETVSFIQKFCSSNDKRKSTKREKISLHICAHDLPHFLFTKSVCVSPGYHGSFVKQRKPLGLQGLSFLIAFYCLYDHKRWQGKNTGVI